MSNIKQTELKIQPVQVIRSAINLICDKEHWTQKAFARDGLGEMCSPNSTYAVSYCLVGAMRRVCGSDYGAVLRTMNHVLETIKSGSIPTWQDDKHRTYEEVIDALNKTITRLENEFP